MKLMLMTKVFTAMKRSNLIKKQTNKGIYNSKAAKL